MNHWIEADNREANKLLYPWVAIGMESARERMIENNRGLVIHRVNQFLCFLPQYEYLRNDLVCAGNLALVKGVNQIVNDGCIDGPNPIGFLAKCIQTEVGLAIDKENYFRVPRTTKKRKEAKGVKIALPSRDEADEHQLTYDPNTMADLRETLEACCEDDIDRAIIELRELGWVDREIADELEMPLTTIYVKRRTLYARFLELTGWKGEV